MLVLVVTLVVVGYFVTRPPSRELDPPEQAWVREFEAWRNAAAVDAEKATVGIGFASKARNARLLEPLRTCTRSYRRLAHRPRFSPPCRTPRSEPAVRPSTPSR